jgi:hypothetical protein
LSSRKPRSGYPGSTPFIDRFLRRRAEAFRFVTPDAVSLSRRERA